MKTGSIRERKGFDEIWKWKERTMAKPPTPDAISKIFTNLSLDSLSEVLEIIVQILDLKSTGNRFMKKPNRFCDSPFLLTKSTSELIESNLVLSFALSRFLLTSPTEMVSWLGSNSNSHYDIGAAAVHVEGPNEYFSRRVDLVSCNRKSGCKHIS